jgi:hypothetical protein
VEEVQAYRSMLVVPVQDADTGARFQKLPPLEGPAKDSVGGGVEEDREEERLVQNPGPPGTEDEEQPLFLPMPSVMESAKEE